MGPESAVREFFRRLQGYEAARKGRRITGGEEPDSLAIPEGIEWFVWRPVFSVHAGHVSKAEIDNQWSIVDLLECHELIDIHDELDRRAAMKARARTRR